MIGYAPNGYRLCDKETRKVTTARDVEFDESSCPYAAGEILKSNTEYIAPLLAGFPLEQKGEDEAVHKVDDEWNAHRGTRGSFKP